MSHQEDITELFSGSFVVIAVLCNVPKGLADLLRLRVRIGKEITATGAHTHTKNFEDESLIPQNPLTSGKTHQR